MDQDERIAIPVLEVAEAVTGETDAQPPARSIDLAVTQAAPACPYLAHVRGFPWASTSTATPDGNWR